MESSGDIEFSRADVTLTIAPNSPQTMIAHHQFVEFLEGSQATFRIAPRTAVTRHARHKGFDPADRCLPWNGAIPPLSSCWCLPPLSRLQRIPRSFNTVTHPPAESKSHRRSDDRGPSDRSATRGGPIDWALPLSIWRSWSAPATQTYSASRNRRHAGRVPSGDFLSWIDQWRHQVRTSEVPVVCRGSRL